MPDWICESDTMLQPSIDAPTIWIPYRNRAPPIMVDHRRQLPYQNHCLRHHHEEVCFSGFSKHKSGWLPTNIPHDIQRWGQCTMIVRGGRSQRRSCDKKNWAELHQHIDTFKLTSTAQHSRIQTMCQTVSTFIHRTPCGYCFLKHQSEPECAGKCELRTSIH